MSYNIYTLVLTDFSNSNFSKPSIAAINAAISIGKTDLLISEGDETEKKILENSKVSNINKIYYSSKHNTINYLDGSITSLIKHIDNLNKYTHIFAPSNLLGKFVIPSLYIPYNSTIITEVTKILKPYTMKRFFYTGNIEMTLELPHNQINATISQRCYMSNLEMKGNAEMVDVSNVKTPTNNLKITISENVNSSEKIDLSSASIIVSGGKGFGDAKNFQLVYKLARMLKGAGKHPYFTIVGATRAAVDLKMAPSSCQIGQTGTIVSPNLYFAIGISGSAQHLVGMRDSKTIVAINNDKNARIWSVAHLGIEGDLNQVVPELIDKLDQK